MRRLAIAAVVLLGAAGRRGARAGGGPGGPDGPDGPAPPAPAPDRDGNDVGADAIVIAPFGDWADQTGVGLGGDVRVRVPLGDYTTITARAGGVAHLGKTMDVGGAPATTTILEFPLLGGARYYVSAPGRLRGFFTGEVGFVFRRTDVAIAGAHDHDLKVVFGSVARRRAPARPVRGHRDRSGSPTSASSRPTPARWSPPAPPSRTGRRGAGAAVPACGLPQAACGSRSAARRAAPAIPAGCGRHAGCSRHGVVPTRRKQP